ncbi:MAG: Hsp20/alpha crystallin family protein [Sulfurovum sp.]|nr:Hsp20/alpha crystallin family protein [Sulfurovum sp.]
MLNKKLSLFVLPLVATLSLQANDPFGDDIFKEMMQMQQNMDKMFNQMHQRMQQRTTKLVSPLGTYKIANKQSFIDKGNHYEYVTNIPENKENQIDINSKDGVMAITAKIIEKHENKTANGYSSSSSMRMYQQSIPLPRDADEGSMSAKYKDKRLVVSLKKSKTNKIVVPTINIHTSKSTKSIKSKEEVLKKEDTNKTQESNETKSTDKNSTETNSTKKMTINSDVPSMS